MKGFLGIGNTCVVTSNGYEAELGIKGGYSRGRYMLHTYGAWPDDDKMLEMHARHQEAKKKTVNPAGASTSAQTVD